MGDFFDEIQRVQKEGITLKLQSKKARASVDIKDSSTWHATCAECGCKKMVYYANTFTYHCPKCGNILEV